MKRLQPKSFDDLIKSYYGGAGQLDLSNTAKVEKLFANYYGAPRKMACAKKAKGAAVVAQSFDNGEVLRQSTNGRKCQEYVVQNSADEAVFEEYVVGSADTIGPTPVAAAASLDIGPRDRVNVTQEYQVDVLDALTRSDGSEPTRPRYSPPDSANRVSPVTPYSPRDKDRAKAADDDFISDMQSILSGQMVFDPVTKKTVEKDKLARPVPDNSYSEPPVPDAKNTQAIFDRIAQSMQYANAYDLGTVELENRFADFDRISELQAQAKDARKTATQTVGKAPAVTAALKVDHEDFIKDLDEIRHGHYGGSTTSAPVDPAISLSVPTWRYDDNRDSGCMPYALSLTVFDDPADYSRPLYDTGEHVETAWDIYSNQLRVGKAPGVLFSYGDLVAMGDLYQSVDQMMATDSTELKNVKTLIDRSTAYYKGNKKNDSLDVSDDEWDTVTHERYLELAEDNYEHFSPDALFPNAVFTKNVGKHGTNKSAWEASHKRAITEAQKMLRDPANASRKVFPEWPLIINAFGDHFLTDAFSAGHTINKEVTIEYFKYNFFKGGKLNSQAEKFFGRVAAIAFQGEVRKKFSVLETYDPVILWWNPNIDTVNAFRKLLIKIAEQKPDEIGNLAIKALHDRLNKDGIEVFNDAGDGTWRLTGDGTLDSTNLPIIRKAVQQSIDNINDSAITADGFNADPFLARVWKHVPKLTPGSVQLVKRLSSDYTNPESDVLILAAANLIQKKVDTLIKKLKKAKKLKDA